MAEHKPSVLTWSSFARLVISLAEHILANVKAERDGDLPPPARNPGCIFVSSMVSSEVGMKFMTAGSWLFLAVSIRRSSLGNLRVRLSSGDAVT